MNIRGFGSVYLTSGTGRSIRSRPHDHTGDQYRHAAVTASIGRTNSERVVSPQAGIRRMKRAHCRGNAEPDA